MAEREYRLPEPNQYEADKAAFLKQFSDSYGYSGRIDQIRDKEYPQLKGKAYLDHAGTTTYNQSTITNFHADLSHNLFGNPHSKSPSSKLATDRVEGVRLRVLQHFRANPDHYDVIFTANTTAAIKMVGEAFPWEKDITTYRYLREGHTSLIGLRRFAEESNVYEIKVTNEFEVEEELLPKHVNNPHFHNNIHQVDFEGQIDGVPVIPEGVHYNLFAYPAQCNFSGMRFPLDWIRRVKQTYNTENSKTLVLLDAAAYTTTSPISLEDKENSPDFMSISFYKLFGYPTGLGALIIKKELSPILKKRYFGGGTVSTVFWNMTLQRFHEELHERYEDGTINFLGIIALEHAFNSAQRLYKDFTYVRAHVTSLNQYLFKEMDSLRHWNGTRVCAINSDRDFSDWTRQGPILSFNLKRADGSWVGYTEVEHLSSVNGIHVRVGAHCNAGSVARWCNVGPEDYENKSCHDDQDIVNGKPMGAVRISLGAMTSIDDILVWLDFLKAFFVEGAPPTSMFKDLEDVENDLYDLSDSAAKALEASPRVALDTISLFPIKSCHAYQVPSDKSWPVTTQGLLYDREWVLLNPENGQALNQKRHPKMALIKPRIDLEEGVLEITAPDYNPICIALDEYPAFEEETTTNASVCGDRTDTLSYTSPEITEWFANFLGVPCVLARQPPAVYNEYPEISINRRFIKRHLEESSKSPLSFSNESPFLLISQESVNNINSKVRDAGNEEIETECFRGNFVVRGTSEYEEDDWELIKFGDQAFRILGPCRRCNMVTVNQETAERTSEPYSTLSKHRKFDNKIYFGQHMIHVPELSQAPYNLRSGAPLKILERTRPIIAARF